MALEVKVFTLLDGTTYITDVVSSSLYAGSMPNNVPYPAIVYSRNLAEPINYLSGNSSGERIDLEISCYATLYKDSIELSTIVERIMFGSGTFKAQLITNRMEITDLSDRKKVYNTRCNFGIWNQR